MLGALRAHEPRDRAAIIDTLRECEGCVRFLPRDPRWGVLARLGLVREGTCSVCARGAGWLSSAG